MSDLKLAFLGPPILEYGTAPIKLKTKKTKALLIYLAVSQESCRRDLLVNLLWPESSHTKGRTLLRGSLYDLRKTTEYRWLDSDRETVHMTIDSHVWVDVLEFQKTIASYRSHNHDQDELCSSCEKGLSRAAALYRGDFLQGFSLNDSVNYDEWQSSQAQRLQTEWESLIEHLIHHYLAHAKWELGKQHALRWLESDPANEAAHRYLMELYLRSGQRTSALRQYEKCRQILSDELGTWPHRSTTELYNSMRSNRLPDLPECEPRAVPHNLPLHLTKFIGRKREIKEIQLLIKEKRLVTLSGVGGCGKTRLALQVASQIPADFRHGVRFVDLTALSDPAGIPKVIADALGLFTQPEVTLTEVLCGFLKEKQILLIIDNCEHLIESCARLTDHLLRECIDLKILATSREPMSIAGEIVWRVPSLSSPDLRDHENMNASEVSRFEAAQLFINCAKSVSAGFELTDENTSFLAYLCARLDGIPLAIELAATHVKVLSLQKICERLSGHFSVLSTDSRTALPRHQTLRTAIDWSHDLLSEKERVLFRRMSVFSGGYTLDAAEDVCTVSNRQIIRTDEILDLITHLIDKSLVIADGDRYKMLEIIRQYALEKLGESGNEATIRTHHANWILRFAEYADPKTKGPDQLLWFDRLTAEMDNIRGALKWCVESGEIEKGMRIAWALMWFYMVKGHYQEGFEWLERLLKNGATDDPLARVKGLNTAGCFAWFLGKRKSGYSFGKESLTLSRIADDSSQIAWSIFVLGLNADNVAQRKEHFKECLEHFRNNDDKWGEMQALRCLGADGKDEKTARRILKESLTLCRKIEERVNLSWLQHDIGKLDFRLGDYQSAVERLKKSVELSREIGHGQGMAQSYERLGSVYREQNNYRLSREMYGKAISIFRNIGLEFMAAGTCRILVELEIRFKKWRRAAKLLGAMEKCVSWDREELQEWFEVQLGKIGDNLSESSLTELMDEGRKLDVD